MRDFYETLYLTPEAEPEVIVAAYRALAKKYHPDLNNNSEAAQRRMKEINDAYDIIGNEDKRLSYDLQHGYHKLQEDIEEEDFEEEGFEEEETYSNEELQSAVRDYLNAYINAYALRPKPKRNTIFRITYFRVVCLVLIVIFLYSAFTSK